MVTRTCAGVTSNSRQASITSSPLFSIVAESMVMRRPITHVGCFSACSGVMFANCSSGSCRNGPPDAVSRYVAELHLGKRPAAAADLAVLRVDLPAGEEPAQRRVD